MNFANGNLSDNSSDDEGDCKEDDSQLIQEDKHNEEESEEVSESDKGEEIFKAKRVKFTLPVLTDGNITRRLQGLMNKLNESNIQTIFKAIEQLYRDNSHNGEYLSL